MFALVRLEQGFLLTGVSICGGLEPTLEKWLLIELYDLKNTG